MMFDARIGIAAAGSVVGHLLLTTLLGWLPPEPPPDLSPPVVIRVIEPKVEPLAEPDPEPEPAKPEPTPPPKPEPKQPPPKVIPKQVQAEQHAETPHDTPPTDTPPNTTDTTDTPVFGVTMESTSQGGNGPAVHVGNTMRPGAGSNAAPSKDPVKPLAAPVAAYEVTKMPLPQGRCAGKYTDEARAAAIEGVVVLDLTVDENGRAREITVVQRLEHGLTEAAIAAVTACTFTPGEKGGQRVPVRVRGFKIRFLMQDA